MLNNTNKRIKKLFQIKKKEISLSRFQICTLLIRKFDKIESIYDD